MASKKQLDEILARLNKKLGRPATAYVRTADGKLRAQVGHLYAHCGASGSSKCPYSLDEIGNEGGGIRQPLGSRYYSAGELRSVLLAIEAVLDSRFPIGGAQ